MPSHTEGRSRAFRAKCEANQALVDLIGDKRERVSQSNYSFTLKKAMESLCKSKEAITSYEEAIELNGIGPSIASLLFQKHIAKKQKPGVGRKTKKNDQRDASSSQKSYSGKQCTIETSVYAPASIEPPRRPPKQHLQTLMNAKEKPSRKEAAYQKACSEAEKWKGKMLEWKLVLLIDGRERKAEHYSSKIQQCGIPTDIRNLPIGRSLLLLFGAIGYRYSDLTRNAITLAPGDMIWIAQGSVSGTDTIDAELLLGTIIERKEVSDLKSSLFGTRYNEQQLRLKDSGQPQVIFLIEGDLKKDLYRCPAETLHSVLWNIRIDKNNQVIQTAHIEDTVNTLRRIHRRMLKRTFPTAFFAEALPSFAGPEAGSSRRGARTRDSFGEQRRKRRRRLESLHGLVFDEEPVPMAGMERFTTCKLQFFR